MNIGDIEGTKARVRHPEKNKDYNNLDYRDTYNNDFRTTRTTNPLNPSYTIRNEAGDREEIGDIMGSKPNKMPERKRGQVSSSLSTKDIEGATAGSKGKGVFAYHNRRDVREVN